VAALLARVKPDDAIIPKLQSIIERQVGHMARMVDDLLDVTRASTGKLNLDLKPTDLATVLTRAVEQRHAAMDLRLQHFTSHVPLHPVTVRGDGDRLVQVVSNLLDNASRYTPNGGDIGLTLTVENNHALIVVRDSGIGISATALPTIFELFTQDRHAVGFNGAGLGIGLTVVHELVVAHGGTVTARSSGIGEGSEFVVSLPLLTAGVDS
jgi:signal transduction histidine kinase